VHEVTRRRPWPSERRAFRRIAGVSAIPTVMRIGGFDYLCTVNLNLDGVKR
jgi:hypothetical protein